MTIHRRAFLKRLGFTAAGLSLVPTLRLSAATVGAKLPRSSPEAQGVASAGILAFLEAIGKSRHEFHSFIMARHGQVIAEGWWTPYRATAPHMLYSLSKSFTSTAIGLAVTEGRLAVEDPVIKFFPDKAPSAVSENLAALRVKHLLSMSVGQAQDSIPIICKEQDWVKTFLSLPIAHPPGSVFLYNSGATYMLSAIVQKLTGQKVVDYLRPRLFEPLNVASVTWETCPLGINTGGWGLAIQTETIAKFAQLYLQNGLWNDRQLIPAAWVHQATTAKIQQPAPPGGDLEKLKLISEWHQGYCYQFWRCTHHGFRGDGAFGQYAIVLPEKDTVIAITSETADMPGEMALIWEHLYPAIKDAPLAPDAAAHIQLQEALAALALPLAAGEIDSPLVQTLSGKTFKLEPNDSGFESLAFAAGPQSCTITLRDASSAYPISCGIGKWVESESNLPGIPQKLTVGDLRPVKVAASAAWKNPQTLTLLCRYYETPHHDTVTLQFDGDKVTLTRLGSIPQMQSHPDPRPVLHGMMT
ncbi:MAG TPA: serine hydrolase [Verrucomicrobiae bacterium]|jgi:CubicO group peptidase (beta-lactamase class C family)|nr:serine hydrolase [Verrucomicrobiae bacterium]